MAEQPPNNGRERLDFTVGGKSIGVAARDLLSVLMLIVIAGGVYLTYTAIEQRLDLLHARQDLVVKQLLENKEHVRHILEQLHKMLWVHDFNTGRPPEERLPLVLEAPPAPKP